jgi:hypothetical protein
MKVLSIRAPWWLAILRFGKDIENRDWKTNFRGTVYIHASSWFHPREILQDIDAIAHICKMSGHSFGGMLVEYLKQGCGRIVGRADIVNCVEQSASPWFFGKYGFVLRNPVAFKHPIPCRGKLGFFDLPDDVGEQIEGLVECGNCGELAASEEIRVTDDDVDLCAECWDALKDEMVEEAARLNAER